MPGASQTRAYVALSLIVPLWASFPALIKFALADFPPFFFAAVRCVCASLFLAVSLARASEDVTRGLTPASLQPLVILGVVGIFEEAEPEKEEQNRPPAARRETVRPAARSRSPRAQSAPA